MGFTFDERDLIPDETRAPDTHPIVEQQPVGSDGQMKLREPLSSFSELTRWRSLFTEKD